MKHKKSNSNLMTVHKQQLININIQKLFKHLLTVIVSALVTIVIIRITLSGVNTASLGRQQDLLTSLSELMIDPVTLIQKMDKHDKDFILVDVRSPIDFSASHIMGAVNVPLYINGTNVKNDQEIKKVIRKSIDKLMKENKLVIIYGITSFDNSAQILTKYLLRSGMNTKLLSAGYIEWKYLILQIKNNDVSQYIDPLTFPAFGPPGGPM